MCIAVCNVVSVNNPASWFIKAYENETVVLIMWFLQEILFAKWFFFDTELIEL